MKAKCSLGGFGHNLATLISKLYENFNLSDTKHVKVNSLNLLKRKNLDLACLYVNKQLENKTSLY